MPMINSRQKPVLIVDDDQAVLATIDLILKRRGYKTEVADHIEEALRKLEQNGDDIYVVVTDLYMAPPDGFDLIYHITVNHLYPVGVIVMSGAYTPEQFNSISDSHVDHFLTKPFDADEL